MFAPWDERIAAGLPEDVVWPDDPHWLPTGWRAVQDPVDQMRLVSENPLLATLAGSVNAAAALLPDPDAVMFLNEHLMLGRRLSGVSRDAELDAGPFELSFVLPGPGTVVDDSRLPDMVPLLHLVDAFSRLNLVTSQQLALVGILKKGFPLNNTQKKVEDMVAAAAENDEIFYRTFVYMLLCFVGATYDWASGCPYDFEVQTWIVAFFMNSTHAELVALFREPFCRPVLIYTCTACLVQVVRHRPAYEKRVRSVYDWAAVEANVLAATHEFRGRLVAARHTRELTGPSVEIVRLVGEVLERHYGGLSDDFRTVKNDVSNVLPTIVTAAEQLELAGVLPDGAPNQLSLSRLGQVPREHWWRTLALVREHGAGIKWSTLSRLGMSGRGEATVMEILERIADGDKSLPEFYTRLGPGDFTRFLAYIAVQRHVFEVDYTALSDRIRDRQERAIRERERLLDWQPLPRWTTHLPFCPTCNKFRVFHARSRYTGFENVTVNPLIGKFYCYNKEKPSCGMLIDVPMLGYALTVERQTWMLCCYCGELCRYGNGNIRDSYWWCGSCARD